MSKCDFEPKNSSTMIKPVYFPSSIQFLFLHLAFLFTKHSQTQNMQENKFMLSRNWLWINHTWLLNRIQRALIYIEKISSYMVTLYNFHRIVVTLRIFDAIWTGIIQDTNIRRTVRNNGPPISSVNIQYKETKRVQH